jgi:uncharacterized protein YhaN
VQIRSDLAKLDQLKQQLAHDDERVETYRKIYEKTLERKTASPLSGADLPDIMPKIAAAAETEKAAPSKSGSKTGRRLLTILLICLIAGAAALYLLVGGITLYISAAAAVLCALGLVFLLRPRQKKDRALEEMLSAYNFSSARELSAAAEEYAAICRELDDASRQLAGAQQSLEETQKLLTDCETDLAEQMRAVSPEPVETPEIPAVTARTESLIDKLTKAEFDRVSSQNIYRLLLDSYSGELTEPDTSFLPVPLRNRADTQAALERLNLRLADITGQYNVAMGEIRSMGDPMILSGEKNAVESRIKELTKQYDAISLALETLRSANAELQTRFSPLLSQAAGRIYGKLTKGRYEKIIFGKNLDASARVAGESVGRDVLSLSEGTADQLYLALRLAICELVLPTDDPCPIILDDALSSFDDDRAAAALDLLREMAGTRQIILFTCQSREAAHFKDDASVHLVRMK